MKVYAEHFSEIRKVGSRGFSAMYQFLIYLGVLTVLLQPLKIISFALLLGALAQGLDSLLGLGWLPYSSLTDPVYFLAAMTKSLRWSARILWVHSVTVTRPHSVRIAG